MTASTNGFGFFHNMVIQIEEVFLYFFLFLWPESLLNRSFWLKGVVIADLSHKF